MTLVVVATGPAVRENVGRLLAGLLPAVAVQTAPALTEVPADPMPDVVVLDWPSSDVRGLARALPPGPRLMLLCDPADPPGLNLAIRAGARAFLTRDPEASDLLLAIEAVERGGLHIAADLLDAMAAGSEQRDHELVEREIELLQWVIQGLTNEEIGRRMRLSKSTVTSYVRQVRSKLNAVNKADLTRRAIELGYVVPR